MTDGEQDYGAWRVEQQRRAQAHAWHYAERATTEYEQATQHEDAAHDDRHADTGWQRDLRASHRRQADFHGVRSTEALKLAEMWARVAHALADGELPVTTTLELFGTAARDVVDTYTDPGITG